jgi:phage tail-like protein
MDANGQSFWLLADARHFPAASHALWDADCGLLRLASERTLAPALAPAAALAAAQAALDVVPRAVDAAQSVARWDAASQSVVVRGLLPDTPLLALADTPTDLCAGFDGVLYVALPGRVTMHDLRGRWADVDVTLAGFAPWRLAPAPGAGVWVMERGTGRVARLAGRPLRMQTPPSDAYDPRVFRPTPENGSAPQLELLPAPAWLPGEQPVALACRRDGMLAVLSWLDADGTAGVRTGPGPQPRLGAPVQLLGADHAYALAWTADGDVVVRVPGRRDVPAFDLASAAAGVAPASGVVYPLSPAAQEASFANGVVQPVRYPDGDASANPLYALSLNNLARQGEASNYAITPSGLATWLIDSGANTTVWHRLVAEANIPAHCGFVVWLAATNVLLPPQPDDLTAWHPHGFGADIATLDDAMLAPAVPRAAWQREASELPGHPGLLGGTPEPGVRGLFSTLVQASRRQVRRLIGRYLWVRVVLHGNGRATPEIAALRAWSGRFSYRDQYLPRLYRESVHGTDATLPGTRLGQVDASCAAVLDLGGEPDDATRTQLESVLGPLGTAATVDIERAGKAWLLRDGGSAWRVVLETAALGVYRPGTTPADFTERLLANFESVLTPMEDRVAAAHLVTDPASAPEADLDWLAGWIGVAFDPLLPAARRRAWLAAAPNLAREHGTRAGLERALEAATGSVSDGSIVVVEDFRLRRILATLLGVDLSDADDPLLPGLARSGNSIVGDTLFVGNHVRAELLALFRADIATAAENAAALAFYDRLAFRATVLVHDQVKAQDFGLIRRIVQLESPAHVQVNVVAATWPLLVGVASLVGVDTYLGPPRAPQPAQIERSVLGLGDMLLTPASLDPRLGGIAG